MKRLLAALLILSVPAPVRALAADLRIGLAQQPTSLDPLFYVAGSNTEIALNIFDQLVRQDARQHLTPGLATDWTAVDDHTWEFRLRPGVTFHDGSPFGPEDVIASVRHIRAITDSPSSMRPFIAGIEDMQVAGPLLLRITTKGAQPLLPNNLSRIAIIPRAMEQAAPADFDAGRAIGTGPFRLTGVTPGASLSLVANPTHWAGPPPWRTAELRFIPNDGARVASLLAGDVDVIDAVPPEATAVVTASPRTHIASTPGNRLIYLHIDSARDLSPFVRTTQGEPLTPSPLRDRRVRQAMSNAIDRTALVDRIMNGQGIPAGQYVPDGYPGYDPTIQPARANPAEARRLLAEAGLPRGFALTIHGPNDRYTNDSKLLQAIAQQFSRVGIATQVDLQPGGVFFTRASKLEFSVILGGAAIETGEAIGVLNPLMATFDPAAGAGTGNRGRWSNPAFDTLLAQATHEIDPTRREAALRQATHIATDDVAVIPVLWLPQIWGLQAGFDYAPRTDGYTLAADIKPVSP